MELGFTHQEVMNMPLRNLAMYQSDKVRVAYGKVMREMSAEEEETFINGKLAGR